MIENIEEFINTYTWPVTREAYNLHEKKWNNGNTTYSSRANIDSEYLEEQVAQHVNECEAITKKPNKYYADIGYKKNLIIDFKEIPPSGWFNFDSLRAEKHLRGVRNGLLTHFLFFHSNRVRDHGNRVSTIPVGYELEFEFIGIAEADKVIRSNYLMPYKQKYRINMEKIEWL